MNAVEDGVLTFPRKRNTLRIRRDGRQARQGNVFAEHADRARKDGISFALHFRRKVRSLFSAAGLWSSLAMSASLCCPLLILSGVWLKTCTQNQMPGQFPRTVRLTQQSPSTSYSRCERLNLKYQNYKAAKRLVHPYKQDDLFSDGSDEKQNSDEDYDSLDEFETQDCRAQYQWQRDTHPSCNAIHEFGFSTFETIPVSPDAMRLVTNGYWRDVWLLREQASNTSLVLKTLRFEHDFNLRNYDRHRRDAVVSEHLTKSAHVVNIYAYCANSGLFQGSHEGDMLHTLFKPTTTKLELLRMATQAGIALAELHNIDKEGQASIAHTDISPTQFLLIDGIYKLNDFNRARFLRWSRSKNAPCPYFVGKNPGKNRSPEEYSYKPQSEKVDVYSLGNIFYMMLQKEFPFMDEEVLEAQRMVKEGYRPSFYTDIWNSTDPLDKALKQAMIMCHNQDPSKRASARQVAQYLSTQLEQLSPPNISK